MFKNAGEGANVTDAGVTPASEAVIVVEPNGVTPLYCKLTAVDELATVVAESDVAPLVSLFCSNTGDAYGPMTTLPSTSNPVTTTFTVVAVPTGGYGFESATAIFTTVPVTATFTVAGCVETVV